MFTPGIWNSYTPRFLRKQERGQSQHYGMAIPGDVLTEPAKVLQIVSILAAGRDGVFFRIDLETLEVVDRLYLGGNVLMGSFIWNGDGVNM